MLVVQTRTRVQGIQAQVRTWLRAPVRMLRKRIQGQDNGGESMSSAGADMQAVRNRWLQKRKSQMNKWLNGFKPKPPKKKKDKITESK